MLRTPNLTPPLLSGHSRGHSPPQPESSCECLMQGAGLLVTLDCEVLAGWQGPHRQAAQVLPAQLRPVSPPSGQKGRNVDALFACVELVS